MNFSELNNKFDAIINDIQSNEMGNIMVSIASDALVTIRERIKESGTNAEGGQYPPYSTNPMLSGCKNFIQKAACERYVKKDDTKWVMIDRGTPQMRPLFVIPGGYKEFREIQGRQTGFVDFSFSNRMWNNIKIVSDNSEHNQGIARIAATTDEDKKKLEGNTKRKGKILKLSQSEISELSRRFSTKITQIFERHGLK